MADAPTSGARRANGETAPASSRAARLAGRLGLDPAVIGTASTHFVVDTYNNIFPPLVPLLVPRLGLTMAMVGTLAMCFQLASSVAQLGFGTLADRWRPRVLLIGGPLLSVAVLSFVGAAPSTLVVALVLLVGGLGGAAFHPPAAALVYDVSGPRKGLAMSVHITGGQMGFSLAPVVFVPAVVALGLQWSWLVALPGLAALAFTMRLLPRRIEPRPAATRGWKALGPHAGPLTRLYAIVVLRTFTAYSFSTFMAVLLTQQGLTVSEASVAVSVYLFCTSVGVFLGGPLADRYGPRRVIIWSLVAAVPVLAVSPLAAGWSFAAIASLGGFLLQSTLPVNVTYGQQLAPESAATVSSIMMGFAWGTGALLVPAVGLAADRVGLAGALVAAACAPLLAVVVAIPLPDLARSHDDERHEPPTTQQEAFEERDGPLGRL